MVFSGADGRLVGRLSWGAGCGRVRGHDFG
jgi:hypothetical protein